MKTPEYLLEKLAKIIAHPHTTILKHDIERAARILIEFDDYVGEHAQDQEDVNQPWINVDENFQFELYLKTNKDEDFMINVKKIEED